MGRCLGVNVTTGVRRQHLERGGRGLVRGIRRLDERRRGIPEEVMLEVWGVNPSLGRSGGGEESFV